jgi:DNA mismatch repair protein MutS
MQRPDPNSPMMLQYQAIKEKYPDAIVLFHAGDFYKILGEDAIIASQVLGITRTNEANRKARTDDFAEFPYHALDAYLHKLVKAGYRVALCDKVEDQNNAASSD